MLKKQNFYVFQYINVLE